MVLQPYYKVSFQDILSCPDPAALLEWGEIRHLRNSKEYRLHKKTVKEDETKTKTGKSTWSNLYSKLSVLFPYLWPKNKPGLQVNKLL